MTNGIRFQSIGALSVAAIIILILLVILLIPLMFLGLIGAAFTRLGFSWISAAAVVLLILFGSAVNIPLYTIKRDMVRMSQWQRIDGRSVQPVATRRGLGYGNLHQPWRGYHPGLCCLLCSVRSISDHHHLSGAAPSCRYPGCIADNLCFNPCPCPGLVFRCRYSSRRSPHFS